MVPYSLSTTGQSLDLSIATVALIPNFSLEKTHREQGSIQQEV